MMMQMDDEPGALSEVLGKVAEYNANILTIHQSVPINGIASLTMSIEVLPHDKGSVRNDGTDGVSERDTLCKNTSQGVSIMIQVAIMGYGTVGSGVARSHSHEPGGHQERN